MKYRILGKGGLRVSAVGLGCMGMSHAYGAVPDRKKMMELLADAVNVGYDFFDTAEVYGTATRHSDNEELLGEALKPFRNKVVISTKFGVAINPSDHSISTDSRPEVIRRSVEDSLRRLQTDYIDIYFQHRMDAAVSPEVVANVMADLIKEGKILHWGISEPTEEYLRRAHAVCPVAAVQNRYSMMARWHEKLFPTLEALGIGFVAFSPLANGLLSNCYTANDRFDPVTDYRSFMPQYKKESFAQNEPLFNLLDILAVKHHATPAQMSLAWMMSKKPWIVPIPGTRSLCRLKENIGAADIVFSSEEVMEIDSALSRLNMSQVFGGSQVVEK